MTAAQQGGARPGRESFVVPGAALVGLLRSLAIRALHPTVIGPTIFGDTPDIGTAVGFALMWARA